MKSEASKGREESIVTFLEKRGLSSDYTEREKLFHQLINSDEEYLSTRVQNIKLLSKLKREKLSTDIAETKKKKAKIEKIYSGEALINAANKYLGNPYDTSADDDDGGGLKQWKSTGKANLKDNYSGEIYITDKRPVVCADLVALSLEESGIIQLPKMKNPYYWRRVNNLEKIAKANPKLFTVIEKNSTDGNINNCMIGDLITYTNKDRGRHIGIVTEVKENGIPTKIINSRFDGVSEIPFLSTQSIGVDYKQKDRYDGFFTPQEGYVINYVIRIKPKKVILAKK